MIPFTTTLQIPKLTIHLLSPPLLVPSLPPSSNHRLSRPPRRFTTSLSLPNNYNSSSSSANQNVPAQHPPRTLFPGGYKRPEIKVPTLILHFDPHDVVPGGDSLEFIDKAVSNSVGIVVLNAGNSGKQLYDAACLVKSVVRDRAYFLVGERVDIASAVNASGVVLSDHGLPTIVARKMMMDLKPESVMLPLVAWKVETPSAALTASNVEGADFLIYSPATDDETNLAFEGGVRTPIFVASSGNATSLAEELSRVVSFGASGLVVSLDDFRVFGENAFGQSYGSASVMDGSLQHEIGVSALGSVNVDVKVGRKKEQLVAGFLQIKDKERKLVERERSVLLEAIDVIRKAAPVMEEVSLLVDAVSQLDDPFLLAIVGEFNSGKSTFVNALLGKRYLKEGVVPTTNDITFLRHAENNIDGQQRFVRHQDGQCICYLPAPILREMNIVDTPGTNVILQRQQRLTEEFVPRADLLLFVISADRPLTESEVTFLRYTQQWKKKVVFVLNKSDLYQDASELEDAMSFIKENARKLLNAENVKLYPVSSRSALEEKLSTSSDGGDHSLSVSHHNINRFYALEEFLYSFLDGSTSTGMERMKLKLETPIRIAERLLSACEARVNQDCRYAKQDLASITDMIESVKEYSTRIENESVTWRRKTLSLIDSTKSRVLDIIQSTLQLSNLDVAASYLFRGRNSTVIPASMKVQNDVVGPALSDAQKLLAEYMAWLQSNNARERKMYSESLEKLWPSINLSPVMNKEIYESLKERDALCFRVVEKLRASATSKLFDQEIREVFLGTFGGLGAAGLSASLLTSVLPTTVEDLLALSLCSAGGYVAILNFPARRQSLISKVNKIADGLAQEVEEAMQKDLKETVEKLEEFVKRIARPYQDAAQGRLDKLLRTQDELLHVGEKIRTLQVEIQNLHVS